MPTVATYDALLSGFTWSGIEIPARPAFVTYSFEVEPADYLDIFFQPVFLASFQPFTTAQQETTRAALQAWASISGLTFLEVPAGRGDMRFGAYDFVLAPTDFHDTTAFAFQPLVFDDPGGSFEIELGGDIFTRIGQEIDFGIIAHEIGHAIGLKHPFDGATTLEEPLDDVVQTVMSYRNAGHMVVSQLGPLDVLAVQALYGVGGTDGSQVSNWSWDATALLLRQTGGPGADAIAGVGVSDLINTGPGADYAFSRAGEDTINGDDGDDTLSGGPDRDIITGGNGNDVLNGDGGDDSLNGGAGDDEISGYDGFDTVVAGAGNDIVYKDDGVVVADGGDGFDELWWILPVDSPGTLMAYGDFTLNGGAYTGFEKIGLWGDRAGDTLVGGALVDELIGDGGADSLSAGEGDDLLYGDSGNDTLSAGAGADTLEGGSGSNYLRGDEGADSIVGGGGFDDINGNMGNDTASGGVGDDWVVGGKENDLLFGDAGGDLVYGNLGADTLDGGSGNDIIRGGQENDVLTGGGGEDYVSGDRGDDTVSGGGGADLFHTFGDAGLDQVTDFNRAEGDRVLLDPGTTHTVAQVGADVVITMGGGGRMVLVGVQLSSLTGDWIFGA